MAPFDPVHLSGQCSIGVLRQVLLQHWFGPVSLSDAQATLHAHNLARRSGVKKVSVIVVVDDLPRLPSQEVRRALAALADETADEVACHATVVLAEGFAGSALRSVATAIFAMSRADYPKRVFATVAEAAVWTAGYTQGLSPTQLEEACRMLMASREAGQQAS